MKWVKTCGFEKSFCLTIYCCYFCTRKLVLVTYRCRFWRLFWMSEILPYSKRRQVNNMIEISDKRWFFSRINLYFLTKKWYLFFGKHFWMTEELVIKILKPCSLNYEFGIQYLFILSIMCIYPESIIVNSVESTILWFQKSLKIW